MDFRTIHKVNKNVAGFRQKKRREIEIQREITQIKSEMIKGHTKLMQQKYKIIRDYYQQLYISKLDALKNRWNA